MTYSEAFRRHAVDLAHERGIQASAGQLGVHPVSIWRWAVQQDRPLRRANRYSEAFRREVVTCAVRLGSAPKAAAEYGVPYQRVYEWALAMGVRLNGRRGRRVVESLDRLLDGRERDAVAEFAERAGATSAEIVRWAVREYLGLDDEREATG